MQKLNSLLPFFNRFPLWVAQQTEPAIQSSQKLFKTCLSAWSVARLPQWPAAVETRTYFIVRMLWHCLIPHPQARSGQIASSHLWDSFKWIETQPQKFVQVFDYSAPHRSFANCSKLADEILSQNSEIKLLSTWWV